MSNTTKEIEQECDISAPCSGIELILHPKDKDLGDFSVRRALPTAKCKMVGPWIFFDHMGPAQFPAGQGINVRPHPHIGIATVTYLFEGEILHRDSIGNQQAIRPGDINLMVAGRGITHSERERPEITAQPHCLHALQLWLALPKADEEIEPAFFHYPGASIPSVIVENVPVRVMMGCAYSITSPVKTFAETLYVEAQLQPGQTLRLPDCEERGVYIAQGAIRIQDTEIPEYSMVILSKNQEVMVTAIEETRIAIIGGEHFDKRFIEWNFVSSRKERIEQAKADWKAGRFAKVTGDETEFIPLPE
jgi:redox-sensitive bicupin YhaK (pirin superfamily)